MTNLEEIVDALASFDVHAGFPDRRRVLGGQLLTAGVTVADIEALGDHCLGTVVDRTPAARGKVSNAAAAARVLVSLLADPEKRTARLKDLADIARAREARQARRLGHLPGNPPTAPAPMQGEDHAKWAFDRSCIIAYCRAVRDRRGMQVAADELGVPVADIPAMIERGRALQDRTLKNP